MASISDRRRINGPSGGTAPPIFASTLVAPESLQSQRPVRTRKQDELRKIFLKTGITPSASGSAYLELETPPPKKKSKTSPTSNFLPPSSSLKISCSVHGPRPLARSAAYNSSLALTTHIKFAPFATRHRRGYVRDSTERDLGAHLETALRGVIIGERWPKSGVDVIITILEGEEDRWWGDELSGGSTGVGGIGGWGMMSVLAGCITVSSAALVDAGIDCVDMISGGVAAIVGNPTESKSKDGEGNTILDPCPAEHVQVVAACVVGYLAQRDEITELWLKGGTGSSSAELVDKAVEAAVATRSVLVQAVEETAKRKFPALAGAEKAEDVEMAG
ncbi:exoribonuclease family protein [Venturia nashicola]|uniref:Exoribonuclease family protein n=1 Tax=Venturia nashicola TaxID=86259 RepID=A0A4Z1PBW6_9PEZI|nr:exoribonuclease family protein [Venturia nashicola]